MSFAFPAAELEEMQDAQEGHMLDTGNVQTASAAEDTFGQEVLSYSNGLSIACGLDMRPGVERSRDNATVVEYDATVRVPIATTVDMRDRFRVTKRFGETLSTALVFEIVAPPQRGPSGIRLMLKRVET